MKTAPASSPFLKLITREIGSEWVYNGNIHKVPPKKTPKKVNWPELASPFGNKEIREGKGKGKGKGRGKGDYKEYFVLLDNQMRKSIVDLFQEIDWEAFCPVIHTKEQEQGPGEKLSVLSVAAKMS